MNDLRYAASSRAPRRRRVWLGLAALLAVAALASAGALVLSRSRPPDSPVPEAPREPDEGLRSDLRDVDGAWVALALRAGRFDELEARLAAFVEWENVDPMSGEIPAGRAFRALSSADPALPEVLRRWRVARPTSAYVRLAVASHYNALAWRARGKKWARDTPGMALEQFRALRLKALPDAVAAVAAEPRLSAGWSLLLDLALGEPQQCLEIAERALEALPASWTVRTSLMHCLTPRWGGSYEAMASVAQQARDHVRHNPHLLWLSGYAAHDRASLALLDDDFEQAERFMKGALERGGDSPRILATYAKLLRKQGRPREALAAIDRGLAVWPDHDDLLEQSIAVLVDLGREREARSAIDRLVAIDPDSREADDWRRWFQRKARTDCAGLVEKKAFAEAIDHCSQLLADYPLDGELHYRLGRAYASVGRYEDAKLELHAAVDADPRHFDAIRGLDWLYARQRDWEPVLQLWTDYLDLEPNDARAWLERGGTFFHAGDRAASCSDLARGCELGSREACEIARRDCRGR